MSKLINFCNAGFSKIRRAICNNQVEIEKWSKELFWIGALSILIYCVFLFRIQLYTYCCNFLSEEYLSRFSLLLASFVVCTLIAISILKGLATRSIVIGCCWNRVVGPVYICISRLILYLIAYCVLFDIVLFISDYLLEMSRLSISPLSRMMLAHTFTLILLSTLLGSFLINLLHRLVGVGLINSPIHSAKFYQFVVYGLYFLGGIIVMVVNLEENNIDDRANKLMNSFLMSFAVFATFISAKNSWHQFVSSKIDNGRK